MSKSIESKLAAARPPPPPVRGGMLSSIIVISPRLILTRLDAANTKLWHQSRLVVYAVQLSPDKSIPSLLKPV